MFTQLYQRRPPHHHSTLSTTPATGDDVAMEELEKGMILNPDEGRMLVHYWLRNPKLAPNSFLRLQIENTIEAVCGFSEEILWGEKTSYKC
ncbi:putative glucose-6-phosphate isomerase [Helianthus annuus]|nr:putative glucose-6-phosphate isomerase [Helianthus annuus]